MKTAVLYTYPKCGCKINGYCASCHPAKCPNHPWPITPWRPQPASSICSLVVSFEDNCSCLYTCDYCWITCFKLLSEFYWIRVIKCSNIVMERNTFLAIKHGNFQCSFHNLQPWWWWKGTDYVQYTSKHIKNASLISFPMNILGFSCSSDVHPMYASDVAELHSMVL